MRIWIKNFELYSLNRAVSQLAIRTIIFRGVGMKWHPIFSDLMRNSIRIRKPTLIGEGGGEAYCLKKEVSIEL